MKQMIGVIIFLVTVVGAHAQVTGSKNCNNLNIDVYKGWINEIKPEADPERIKLILPCFSSSEPESNESKCGGGIYYPDRGFTFYTRRDYVIFSDQFKGTLTLPLFGLSSDDLFLKLGNPKLKAANWEAFQMAYGTLLVYYNEKQKINQFIISTRPVDDLYLCNEATQ
jgi:hypothetical protein